MTTTTNTEFRGLRIDTAFEHPDTFVLAVQRLDLLDRDAFGAALIEEVVRQTRALRDVCWTAADQRRLIDEFLSLAAEGSEPDHETRHRFIVNCDSVAFGSLIGPTVTEDTLDGYQLSDLARILGAKWDHLVSLATVHVLYSQLEFGQVTILERPHGQFTSWLRDAFERASGLKYQTYDPSWRTSTAAALAAEILNANEFSAMPILADALQDAGCTDEVVLHDLRTYGSSTHGSWPTWTAADRLLRELAGR